MRLLNWSVGAVAMLLLAMVARGRNEKLPQPTTEGAGRADALPETDDMAPFATPAAPPSAARSPTPASPAPSSTAAAAPANPTASAPTQPGLPVAAAERVFIAEAAASGQAEIDAGRMMAARSTDPGVKTYARQLEREHANSNEELKRIAAGKGIALPAIGSKESQALLDRLRNLSAPDGDRTFVREFGIEAHNKSIQLFEKQAREGQDPQLRTFAEQTLPRLREHLIMAQQLQGKAAVH